MTPQQLQETNPELATMSDSYIQAVADQMDMMANNPQWMAILRETSQSRKNEPNK